MDAYHPALYGGTGESASLDVAQAVMARVPRLMLAGGLAPGVKDLARVRAFVAAVRAADAEVGV